MTPLRSAGWLGVAGLLATFFLIRPEPPADARRDDAGPVSRLLGPFARLAASVQWIRFERARSAGRHELAIARAESAIALDPGDTSGWDLLAWHLAVNLSSVESEPDPRRRLAWVRAGLDVARRGEASARDPGALAYLQGLLLFVKAENDPELPWPGGVKSLWLTAAEHFERAEALGYPNVEDAASYAREAARE